MSFGASVLLVAKVVAWATAAAWVAKLVESAVGMPKLADLLEAEHDRVPEGEPWLAVIVPARNEAAKVRACLESLVEQDYARLRVLAADDRSTDTTGEIVDAAAARSAGRLEAMHVRELPEGWLGKTHAMSLAVTRAMERDAPEWLLFTDADVVFSPSILRRSVAYAEASGVDHLVVLPTTIACSTGEAMLLSFLQVLSLWIVRVWRVGVPGSRDSLGVGAFNMIRSEAYRAIGGFEAMPLAVVEDLELGRRVKAAGWRQRVAVAPGAVEVHWAPGMVGVLHGMTKNTFAIFGFRPWLLMGGALGMAALWLVPVVALAVPGAKLAGALGIAAIAGLYALYGRTSRISGWHAALFPVSAVLVTYSMVRSMWVTLRDGGVTWRGTFYPLAVLRQRAR